MLPFAENFETHGVRCFSFADTIGKKVFSDFLDNWHQFPPNFPQCFPANCALLSHQFPPTFLSISIRLPPNFPLSFPQMSWQIPQPLRVGYLGHAKPRFSQARMPYKGQPQHPSEISFSAHPTKMTCSGHDIPPSTKVP